MNIYQEEWRVEEVENSHDNSYRMLGKEAEFSEIRGRYYKWREQWVSMPEYISGFQTL